MLRLNNSALVLWQNSIPLALQHSGTSTPFSQHCAVKFRQTDPVLLDKRGGEIYPKPRQIKGLRHFMVRGNKFSAPFFHADFF